jgi:phi13 family phage major tail protein
MANKIVYGISNVHVWPITATSAAGVPTYGEVFAMPGATEVSIDAEGSSDPFYADDTVYYQGVSNTGYSGSITLADIPAEFLENVMQEIKASSGTYFEDASKEPLEFAMAFEFKGDQKKRRHLFYRCKATRPSIEASTKEDTIEPNTSELELTVMPRLDNNIVKARCEEGDSDYANWYTTPVEYAAPTNP